MDHKRLMNKHLRRIHNMPKPQSTPPSGGYKKDNGPFLSRNQIIGLVLMLIIAFAAIAYAKTDIKTDMNTNLLSEDLPQKVSIPGEDTVPMKTYSMSSATTYTDKKLTELYSDDRLILVSATLPNVHTFYIEVRNDYIMTESVTKITIDFNMIDINGNRVGDYKIYVTETALIEPGETETFQGKIEYKYPKYITMPEIKNIEISKISIEG